MTTSTSSKAKKYGWTNGKKGKIIYYFTIRLGARGPSDVARQARGPSTAPMLIVLLGRGEPKF